MYILMRGVKCYIYTSQDYSELLRLVIMAIYIVS